jgi:hypothetical protein
MLGVVIFCATLALASTMGYGQTYLKWADGVLHGRAALCAQLLPNESGRHARQPFLPVSPALNRSYAGIDTRTLIHPFPNHPAMPVFQGFGGALIERSILIF